jgi:haloalkane dehalogenase
MAYPLRLSATIRGDVRDLAFREEGDAGAPVALLLHGYPNSSYLWKDCLRPIAEAGWRAVAPDFAGYGDSEPFENETGTWTDHVASLDDFVAHQDLAPVALVAHDWGALIGLRWACNRQYAISSLVIMSSGFFPDGKWHGLAQGLRTEGQGEQILASITRETFGDMLRSASPNVTEEALDEYWKGYSGDERRAAQLAMYRSGDFAELEQYDGCLAAMDVPTLLLWGENDEFAPVAGAHRFKKEIPHAELVVIEDAGHFVQEDAPERVCAELVRFLGTVRAGVR